MPSKTVTLTIVIPAYNEQRYLKGCLEAIARQTEQPNQVIVVDNNSTDKTARIAKSYSFVQLVKEDRQGIVFARNAGFNAAGSTLIGRIDADTMLPPAWVEQVKQAYLAANSPDYFAATAPSHFRNRLGKLWFLGHRLTYFWPSRLLMGHTTLVGSNMFLTQKLWLGVKDDVCLDTNLHEDMDLAFHIAKKGVAINFCPALKASITARKMATRAFYYPLMMARVRTSQAHS